METEIDASAGLVIDRVFPVGLIRLTGLRRQRGDRNL